MVMRSDGRRQCRNDGQTKPTTSNRRWIQIDADSNAAQCERYLLWADLQRLWREHKATLREADRFGHHCQSISMVDKEYLHHSLICVHRRSSVVAQGLHCILVF